MREMAQMLGSTTEGPNRQGSLRLISEIGHYHMRTRPIFVKKMGTRRYVITLSVLTALTVSRCLEVNYAYTNYGRR